MHADPLRPGGGYRATLFGLGSLQRLNDAGLLGRLDRVTSVSGGSILAGVLAHRWKELEFVDGRATNFNTLVVEPVRAFCGRTIDVGAGLKGVLTPFRSAGDFLAARYDDDLFDGTRSPASPPCRWRRSRPSRRSCSGCRGGWRRRWNSTKASSKAAAIVARSDRQPV